MKPLKNNVIIAFSIIFCLLTMSQFSAADETDPKLVVEDTGVTVNRELTVKGNATVEGNLKVKESTTLEGKLKIGVMNFSDCFDQNTKKIKMSCVPSFPY